MGILVESVGHFGSGKWVRMEHGISFPNKLSMINMKRQRKNL